MGFIGKIVAIAVFLFNACFSLCEAGEEKPFSWSVPLVQEVKMPAGVRNGVFYPEHDELVVIRPGAWGTVNMEGPQEGFSAPEPEAQDVPVTLAGRVKLFEALKIIAGVSGQALVLGAGVRDEDVSLDFKDTRISRVLAHLLFPRGYGFKSEGDDLVILARDTRTFRLNLPPVAQAFDTATTNESSSIAAGEGGETEGRMRVGAKVLVENSSGTMSYWQDVETNVKGLVSPTGIVSFNRAAGVVVVTDAPPELDRIGAFLAEMNERVSRQIIVDVKVVEVRLSREHKLGIDWSALFSRGDLKGINFSTNFAAENISSGPVVTFSGRADKEGSGDAESGVKAVLKALASFGRTQVISQPRIMMLNNSVASIQVGETRSYVESTHTEATQGGSTITSASLNEVHGGVTLQIIGSIVGDEIFLDLTPVVSIIDDIRTITLGGGNKLEAPDTSVKTMSTMVRVKAGRTVAIGGLITRDRSKQRYGVPFLSRLPLAGKVFSYESRRNDRTELVIFITPRKG